MARHKLINRQKKKQKAIFALKCPRSNKLLNDPTEFPNIFNNFFASVLEISQNKALKRKYMTAYFKSFHKQTIILIYLPYKDKCNIFKIVRNSPTCYLCNHLNSVLVSF